MKTVKAIANLMWAILPLAALALILWNFMAQPPEVDNMAQSAACAAKPSSCTAAMRRYEKTPFSRTWDFDVGSEQVRIRCQRQYILVGEYACHREP